MATSNQNLTIKRIQTDDIADLSSVLTDAVTWMDDELLTDKGSQWLPDEVTSEKLLETYANDEIYIGYLDERPVCSVIIQKKDNIFWQGANHDDALYLHKLSVVSDHRGTGLAEELVNLVYERASELGKYYVRLDCDSTREKLCHFYTNLGFQHQGNVIVGSFHAARYQKTI